MKERVLPSLRTAVPDTKHGSRLPGGRASGSGSGSSPRTMGKPFQPSPVLSHWSRVVRWLSVAAFDVVPEVSAAHAAESDEAAFDVEPNTFPVWISGIPGLGRVLGLQLCSFGISGPAPAEGLFALTK